VIPFLISGGPHATGDIPARLGLQTTQGAAPPFHGRVGDRFIICDAAVGTHAEIVDVIVDLATAAAPLHVEALT
jgi:sirohydrochlorin ferrochelatase